MGRCKDIRSIAWRVCRDILLGGSSHNTALIAEPTSSLVANDAGYTQENSLN